MTAPNEGSVAPLERTAVPLMPVTGVASPTLGAAVPGTSANAAPAAPTRRGRFDFLVDDGSDDDENYRREDLDLDPDVVTDFDAARFLRPEKLPPVHGWRRALWKVSAGHVTPSPSSSELREQAMIKRIQARVQRCQRIAIASGKGGVGKTTATVLCGTALAMHRLDRIIAIDANPDAGSLGWRVERETEATLTDLLRHASRIERYSDVRALTSQAPSRLEVLASELDPAISQALGEGDYARVLDVLERFYSVVLCDLGTGLLDSATQGVLRMANELVIVASPAVDAGRVASFTLDFIERRYPEKARNAVVLINNVRKDGLVDVRALEQHFRARVRAVIRVPYDRHLATGGPPSWELLNVATRHAYTEAAAALAEGFATSSR